MTSFVEEHMRLNTVDLFSGVFEIFLTAKVRFQEEKISNTPEKM
jgi:hypothetical protein